MKLGNQAKALTEQQISTMLGFLERTGTPARNRVILLLSVYAGLRAKEISSLEWRMVLTSEGKVSDTIALESKAAKMKSGGAIPMKKELKLALMALHDSMSGRGTDPVILSEKSNERMSAQVIVNLFQRWYTSLGFQGCSSHSGRRTFITKLAKNVSRVGGSIRDVQALARHASMATTQLYIEMDSKAQRKLVDLI